MYNYKIDFMKSIAILFVILIHSISLEQRNIIGGPYYILKAVPIFIIISGYNYANSYIKRDLNIRECYNKNYLLKNLVEY